MLRPGKRRAATVRPVAPRALRALLLGAVGLVAACGLPAPPATPSPAPAVLAEPTASPEPSAAPTPAPSPPRPPAVTRPSPSPSPSPGVVPSGGAFLTYVPERGIPFTVERLQASCTRSGDSLGLFGSRLDGAAVARYQFSIAPFRGSGTYRTDGTASEVGGSISIVGRLSVFIGPPFETAAAVAGDGLLGQVRFSGAGLDGKRVEGVVVWECADVRRL